MILLYFAVKSKFISDNIMYATDLIEEIILHSDFSDAGRLKTLVKHERTRLETSVNRAAHVLASMRASASISKNSLLADSN